MAVAMGLGLAQDEARSTELFPALPLAQAGGEVEENLPFQGTGDKLSWKTTGQGQLGSWATIDIQSGMGFLNGRDTDELMQSELELVFRCGMSGRRNSAGPLGRSAKDKTWRLCKPYSSRGRDA